MIIKICGITSVDDALLALQEGANALGFNFWPSSSRYILPETARRIIVEARRHFNSGSFLTVGVLVGSAGWEKTPTDVLQLHGFANPDLLPKTERRIWVAVSPETVKYFPSSEILIDSSWGSGQLADWGKLEGLRRPYILAGGLTPENVASAIERLRPAGVDVCSSVERSPGRKDPQKLKRFLGEVKRAAH